MQEALRSTTIPHMQATLWNTLHFKVVPGDSVFSVSSRNSITTDDKFLKLAREAHLTHSWRCYWRNHSSFRKRKLKHWADASKGIEADERYQQEKSRHGKIIIVSGSLWTETDISQELYQLSSRAKPHYAPHTGWMCLVGENFWLKLCICLGVKGTQGPSQIIVIKHM